MHPTNLVSYDGYGRAAKKTPWQIWSSVGGRVVGGTVGGMVVRGTVVGGFVGARVVGG